MFVFFIFLLFIKLHHNALHKKWSFPLRISSVNEEMHFFTEMRISSRLLKKYLMENFIFCAVCKKSDSKVKINYFWCKT